MYLLDFPTKKGWFFFFLYRDRSKQRWHELVMSTEAEVVPERWSRGYYDVLEDSSTKIVKTKHFDLTWTERGKLSLLFLKCCLFCFVSPVFPICWKLLLRYYGEMGDYHIFIANCDVCFRTIKYPVFLLIYFLFLT